MRRHTIASLMLVTVVIAVAVAALKNASDAWAGGLLLLTLLLLGAALLAIPYRREGKRAFWLGFAAFGWGYLVLTQAPWFAEQVSPRLPTTQLLSYAHAKAHPQQQWPSALRLFLSAGSSPANPAGVTALQAPGPPGTVPGEVVLYSSEPTSQGSGFAWLAQSNLEQFERVGHCLFALLFALMGAGIARWFHRTNPAAPAA